MQNYRTTELKAGFSVTEIMSFFTTCFDCATLTKNRRETYPFWALIYTKKGSLTFRIGEKSYSVSAGEIIFYPPDVPHSIVSFEEKSWEVSFMTFNCEGERMQALAGRILTPDGETTEILRRLFALGGDIFYNLPGSDGVIGMYCRAEEDQLMQLKLEIERALMGLYRGDKSVGFGRRREVFSLAVAYMQEHLGDQISLSALASELGVSVSALKAAFKRESGGGVNSYYIDMKLKKGAEWLRAGDMTVGEIAEGLGFSSQFYFSETFKKRYGLSPLAYRKQQANEWRELL